MSATKSIVPAGLEKYVRLNPSIWYLQAPSPASSAPTTSPDLILLLGWMGATPRHLSKYTTGYTALYPTSSILAVTTSAYDAAVRSNASNAARLSPALEVLYSLPPKSKVLLHFFSNGGAATTTFIASMYRLKTGSALPISGMILDSNPGRPTFKRAVAAFAVGLPKNPILKFIGQILLSVTWVVYTVFFLITRKKEGIALAREKLNNEDLVGKGVPRLYLYGVKDPMVGWKDVEEHAEEAEKLGYRVEKEKFTQSGHCGHLIVEPERYWKAVQKLWGSTQA